MLVCSVNRCDIRKESRWKKTGWQWTWCCKYRCVIPICLFVLKIDVVLIICLFVLKIDAVLILLNDVCET